MMSLQLVVLALLMSPFALAEEYEIATTWDSKPINHEPVIIQLEAKNSTHFNISVNAPFFNDPPPSGQPGDPFYGLWEYEVVEIFLLNDDDQYVEIELSPLGQHLVLLLNGRRKTIRHSLFIDFKVSRSNNRWQGEAIIPVDYLPRKLTKMNAYAIHGVESSRVYESLYPVPSGSATDPDFHKLEAFQPFNSSIIVRNNYNAEFSPEWLLAFYGFRQWEIRNTWNGTYLPHAKYLPYLIIEARSNKGLVIGINTPFYDDVIPPPTPSGWPSGILSSYEVFHVFFYGTDNRSLELQFGLYGHYDVVFWVDQQTSVKDLTDVITFQTGGLDLTTDFWTGLAVIPFDYLPPGVSKINVHYVHGPTGNRTILSLYPKESNATNQSLHDEKYAKALDMSMLYPGNEKTDCSPIWTSKSGSNCPNSAGNIRTHFSLVLLIVMTTFFTTLANRIY